MNRRQRQRAEALLVGDQLRRGILPEGMRYRRPQRSKYGDLQALRATRGVGKPPAERVIQVMRTDLVTI